MSNRGGRVEGQATDVAYARECDPGSMPFDDWWSAKERIWGGDDGVHPIPLSSAQKVVAKAKTDHTLMSVDIHGWRSWFNGGLQTF